MIKFKSILIFKLHIDSPHYVFAKALSIKSLYTRWFHKFTPYDSFYHCIQSRPTSVRKTFSQMEVSSSKCSSQFHNSRKVSSSYQEKNGLEHVKVIRDCRMEIRMSVNKGLCLKAPLKHNWHNTHFFTYTHKWK